MQWTKECRIDKWNVQLRFGLCLPNSKYNILKRIVLASSTACWSQTKIPAIEICPLNPMDPLNTQVLTGHLTCPVDPLNKWNVQ